MTKEQLVSIVPEIKDYESREGDLTDLQIKHVSDVVNKFAADPEGKAVYAFRAFVKGYTSIYDSKPYTVETAIKMVEDNEYDVYDCASYEDLARKHAASYHLVDVAEKEAAQSGDHDWWYKYGCCLFRMNDNVHCLDEEGNTIYVITGDVLAWDIDEDEDRNCNVTDTYREMYGNGGMSFRFV